MAGNRKIYQEAIKEGANHAWEQQWPQAVEAYQRALHEFPNEVAALAGIGLAFSEVGRLGDALEAYKRAGQQDRADPSIPERIANILERLERSQEAADAYLESAERYLGRDAPTLALERWQDAVRVYPQSIAAHTRLLQTYLAQNDQPRALRQYIALAEIYQAEEMDEKALELLQYALRINPHNASVLELMDRIRFQNGPAVTRPGTGPLEMPITMDDSRGSPIEITRQKALTDLAEAVFDESLPQTTVQTRATLSKFEIDGLISKALDAQTCGDAENAVDCYERVLQAGVVQPAVHFNLGLLYQQQLRFDEAITQFEQSVGNANYRLGSHFALGECQRARGHIDVALKHFIEVLKIVDLATVEREQADDLIQLYEELARTYAAKGEQEQAVDFIGSLIEFLGARGWEDKVSQARERLDAVSHEGPMISLAEMLSVRDSTHILESLGLAQEYLRRGWQDAALDELDRAVLLAPTHLPTHRLIGEVLLMMGNTEQAVTKLLTVADLYRVRGNVFQAMAMYERALSLAPMNTVVRTKLIELLVSHGEIDKALEHYMLLGNSYYQMAQFDWAREKYSEALRLAPRGNPERRWAVRILHRIGDIDAQRVDWRRAVSVYEEIRNLAPDDEKARMTLIDLYRRFGQTARATMELDGLIDALRASGKVKKVIPLLLEIVQESPGDIRARTRLAQAYLDARDTEGALYHLDVLGDLQLQAGRIEDAIKTIQLILRLQPPNADAYHELLAQLMEKQRAL